MGKFIPRVITLEQEKLGYNNEGRGECIGYLAEPDKHEETCRYRITTCGDADKTPHEPCSCRLGLWRETTAAERVVNDMRKSMKRTKKPAKTKTKRPAQGVKKKVAPKRAKKHAARRS
jgi:hypothetical protein